MTAICIKNRLPSLKVETKTPHEIVFNMKPSVERMCVFGCLAYVLTRREKRDPKLRRGLCLGYEEPSKAYRVCDIESGKVVLSRDVNCNGTVMGGGAVLFKITEENVHDACWHHREFKCGGKRKTGVAQPGDVSSDSECVDSATDDDDDTGPPRRSTRQRTTPIECWRASANMVEASNLSEPTSYDEEAMNSRDQVYWRKAVRAGVDATSWCVSLCQAAKESVRDWYQVGVQEKAQRRRFDQQVQGSTIGKVACVVGCKMQSGVFGPSSANTARCVEAYEYAFSRNDTHCNL